VPKQSDQVIIDQRLNEIREYTTRSLHFIEAKNASFLAFCSVVIAAILATNVGECMIMKLFLYASLVPLLVCSTILAYSFFPLNKPTQAKIKKSKKDRETDNTHLFSAENISQMGKEKLESHILEGFTEYNFDKYENQKVISVLRDAHAAARKYRSFRNASKWLVAFGVIFLGYVVLRIIN